MLTRIKRIVGYQAYARFLAECDDTNRGYLPRQADIPSPYRYSPCESILGWRSPRGYRSVIVKETGHRRYDVFEVPDTMTRFACSEGATQAYLHPTRADDAQAATHA